MNMNLSQMSLNYDMLLQYIFAELTNNLFALTFKCNQSDLCKQLFLLKIANWRTVYIYFMTCCLNINEFKQVLYLFIAHLLKHRPDQSEPVLLLPTSYLIRFSWYFSFNFYQSHILSAQWILCISAIPAWHVWHLGTQIKIYLLSISFKNTFYEYVL